MRAQSCSWIYHRLSRNNRLNLTALENSNLTNVFNRLEETAGKEDVKQPYQVLGLKQEPEKCGLCGSTRIGKRRQGGRSAAHFSITRSPTHPRYFHLRKYPTNTIFRCAVPSSNPAFFLLQIMNLRAVLLSLFHCHTSHPLLLLYSYN